MDARKPKPVIRRSRNHSSESDSPTVRSHLQEMDLDAILARHPNTAVVDELAHTNVPGSKNHKRYEDVIELLDAGINVMTAVNIQHLETLNDAVSRLPIP